MKTIKRKVTKEELDNNSYPLCDRCKHYHNNASTIFGSSWSCSKGKNSGVVCDNSWEIEEYSNLEIYDCQEYDLGDPTTTVLG